MPRQARRKSSTGIYHIMLRGINRQEIFSDTEDHQQFLFTLSRIKKESKFELYGYCLMKNHIHLLIKEGQEPIDRSMKRFGASYVYWYNKKYQRCGHLFQDRFKSEPVESDQYLLVVLRYIHQNPFKDGIAVSLDSYRWSSYNDYLNPNSDSYLTDTGFILDIFSKNHAKATEVFKKFNMKSNHDLCLEDESSIKKYLTDEVIIDTIKDEAGLNDILSLKTMEIKSRNRILKMLIKQGATIRQLSSLTKISKSVIDRTNKE